MHPWMLNVRDTVKLQHDRLPRLGLGHNTDKVIGGPLRVGIAGGRFQQGMMATWIDRWTKLQRAVFGLRRATSAGESIAVFSNHFHRLGAEAVSAVSKAYRLRNLDLL